jgi:hypothetical protein
MTKEKERRGTQAPVTKEEEETHKHPMTRKEESKERRGTQASVTEEEEGKDKHPMTREEKRKKRHTPSSDERRGRDT